MSSGSSLLWRCRRGIREMDLLLQSFVEQYFELLTDEQKTAFEQLLEASDVELMAWIMGRADPPTEQIRYLIEIIQEINQPQSVNSDN